MLTITWKSGGSSNWYLDENPIFGETEYVKCIEASGKELEEIRKTCKNIPDNNKSSVCWHGDLARFIIDSLEIVDM